MLTDEDGAKCPTRAPRQHAIRFAKDAGPVSKICSRHDRERGHRPEQHRAPRPEHNRPSEQNQSARRVEDTDASFGDHRQRLRYLANEIEAVTRERESAHDIKNVMLVGEHGRRRDERKPDHDRHSQRAASVPAVGDREQSGEGDVERGEQIKRRVHGAEPIEDGAEPALRLRTREGEAQRIGEKTNSCDHDRGRDSLRERPQFAFASTQERRHDEKEIDR